MIFTCTKENFLRALESSSGLQARHVSIPIVSNVLIVADESGVVLAATNLEIGIRAHVRAKVEIPGSYTVPAKTLVDYVRLLSDEQVRCELVGQELHIISGSSKTKIKGAPAEEFPVVPLVDEEHAFAVDVRALREAIGKTIISVSKNEIRPELAGVFLQFFSERYDGLLLAATDSYRLSEARVAVSQGKDAVSCIVPGRTMTEISRLLALYQGESAESNVRLWVSQNQLSLRYGTIELVSRLIEGTYPEYAQIIPSTFKTTVIVPADLLVNKIKAASIFTTTGVNAVSLDCNVSSKTLGVSSASTQTGEHSSEIDTDISGEENSILLNHRYILDGLSHMSGTIILGVNGPDAPSLVHEQGKEDFLYIVMPIRQ